MALVAGTRLGRELAWELQELVEPEGIDAGHATGLLAPELRVQIRTTMSRHVGVLRRPERLAGAADALGDLALRVSLDVEPHRRAFEATNLLTVAAAVVEAARVRTESRGCHRRTDYTEPRPVWLTHLTARLDATGALSVSGRPEGA